MGIIYLFLKKMDQAKGRQGKYKIEQYFYTVCNNDPFFNLWLSLARSKSLDNLVMNEPLISHPKTWRKILILEYKKKNPVNQNKGYELIHQKYKANENTSKHNQRNNKNQVKTLCKEDS
jgi:hypothetical protein